MIHVTYAINNYNINNMKRLTYNIIVFIARKYFINKSYSDLKKNLYTIGKNTQHNTIDFK